MVAWAPSSRTGMAMALAAVPSGVWGGGVSPSPTCPATQGHDNNCMLRGLAWGYVYKGMSEAVSGSTNDGAKLERSAQLSRWLMCRWGNAACGMHACNNLEFGIFIIAITRHRLVLHTLFAAAFRKVPHKSAIGEEGTVGI